MDYVKADYLVDAMELWRVRLLEGQWVLNWEISWALRAGEPLEIYLALQMDSWKELRRE